MKGPWRTRIGRQNMLVLKGATIALLIKSLGAALAFGLQVILAQSMTAEHYGHYTLLTTLVLLLACITPMGTNRTIVRFVTPLAVNGHIRQARNFVVWTLWLNTSCVLVVAALGFIAFHDSPESIYSKVPAGFQLSVILLFLGSSVTMGSETLRAFQRIRSSEISNVILRPLLLILLVSGTTWLGHPYISATAALFYSAIASALTVIFAWTLCFRQFSVESNSGGAITTAKHANAPKYQHKLWIAASIPLMVVTVCNFLIGRADVLMLGALIGPTESGYYNAAARISLLAGFPLMAINAVIAPRIARYYASGEREELQSTLSMGAWSSLIATLLITAPLAYFANAMLMVFGESFSDHSLTLQILLLGQIVNAAAGPAGAALALTGQQVPLAAAVVAFGAGNVALNALLINHSGAVGAAIASTITIAFLNIALVIIAIRRITVNPSVVFIR